MLFSAIERDEMPQVAAPPPSPPAPRAVDIDLSPFSLADSYLPFYAYHDGSPCYTENWLQPSTSSWTLPSEHAFTHHAYVPPPRPNPFREEPIVVYPPPAREQYPQYDQYDSGPSVFVARNQHPRPHQVLQGISARAAGYHFQTPITQAEHSSFQTTPISPRNQLQPQDQGSQHDHPSNGSQANDASTWPTTYSADYVESPQATHVQPRLSPNSAYKQTTPQFVDESKDLYAHGIPKSTPVPAELAKKRNRILTPEPDINEFVVVFETAPGALANVKRRRKLDAPVRKAAKEVRKAGACHQCRFRRRTCSTGTPCSSCIKNGHGLQELKCQRESPFVGKKMDQYFEYSSKRRVVSFTLRARSLEPLTGALKETVTIDGVGRLSHPVDVPALSRMFGSFSLEDKDTIRQTEEPNPNANQKTEDASAPVLILEDGIALALEQWAIEYSSKFVHAAGPEFYSTTIAQILGTAYVKKGLPESELISAMLRMASLAFVLRAGVKYSCKSSIPYHFRTIQATVDTILFQRLQLAEKDLFQMLQKLIFRSAGSLNRDQVYPVALVLWQLLRILSIASSHLLNIAQRFQSAASGPADYQLFGLKLVISTHLALFRSSNPLLLDMTDKFNQDLLHHDEELIKLAMEMRKVVMNFRDKGFPEMKGSIAYRKDIFDQFRKVYGGK